MNVYTKYTLKGTFYLHNKTIKWYELIYLQVHFNGLSKVVRIATKGGTLRWPTQYRLAYSEDCVVFNNLLDGAGNNVVIIILNKRTSLLEHKWMREYGISHLYYYS